MRQVYNRFCAQGWTGPRHAPASDQSAGPAESPCKHDSPGLIALFLRLLAWSISLLYLSRMNLLPAQFDSAFAAFERAIEAAGSQSELARIVGCTPANVHQHLRARRLLPARFVLSVEAALGIPRHELRPDIYPLETSAPQAQDPAGQPPASPLSPPPSEEAGGTTSDPLSGIAA